MAEFLDRLLSQPMLTTFVPLALLLILCLLPLLFLVAFFQGRSVSFWPPRIGQRPAKSPTERAAAPRIHSRGQADLTSSTVRHKQWSGIKQKESSVLPPDMNVDSHGPNVEDSRQLVTKRLIYQTSHGRSEEVAFGGSVYVLKRTETDELVDFAVANPSWPEDWRIFRRNFRPNCDSYQGLEGETLYL